MFERSEEEMDIAEKTGGNGWRGRQKFKRALGHRC